MSAFLMSFQSLSNLTNWFYFENDTHGTFKGCKREIFKLFPEFEKAKFKDNWNKVLAEELYKLNCYSLNQRYGDDLKSFPEFEHKEPEKIDIFQCLKSVQCWLYQSCEGDADTKPLYKMMRRIEKVLLNAIVNSLEEYKIAKWE